MVHLVTGQRGSGKSAWLVSRILDAVRVERRVLTNLALDLGKCALLWPDVDWGLVSQFRDAVPKGAAEKGVDYPLLTPPVDAVVIVDEATYWLGGTGHASDELKATLDRCRHNGVDVYLACPDVLCLPAAVRRACLTHYEVVDLSREKTWFFLPGPPIRVVREHVGVGGPVVGVSRVLLDERIKAAYDTTGGTFGMPAGQSETDKVITAARHRHSLVAITVFALVCALVGGSMLLFLSRERGGPASTAPPLPGPVAPNPASSGNMTAPPDEGLWVVVDVAGDVVGSVEAGAVVLSPDGGLWVRDSSGRGCRPWVPGE